MPSKRAIEGLRADNRRLTTLVVGELEMYFRTLDLTDPVGVRDALMAYVPILVEAFGQISQQIALEWYEAMRFESGAAGAFRAIAPPLPDLTPAVEGNIRYAAGHLFKGNPDQALEDIRGSVQKHVRQPGREAIIYNAEYESVYWARVPTGDETCSFCLLLASRGADYLTEKSAGEGEKYGEENKFHPTCDCEIIPIRDGEQYPEGYIPDNLYDVYRDSTEVVGSSNDINLILYDYRRRNPNVRDYVDDPDYLADPEKFLPGVREKLAENRRKRNLARIG